MIYFDNSATTFPKPYDVVKQVRTAFLRYGANPGRSGYKMAMDTAEKVFECRSKAADFFGLDKPENVVFTLNCTHALNIVINGILKGGDHVICSDLEHNAVIRPLYKMSRKGARVSFAKTGESAEETLENFKRAAGKRTKLIVCTHASNVTGDILPIGQIGAFCRERGILFAVDAAQSAGVLDIDMERDCIDFLCVAPHKGLYAPLGTGMLLINTEYMPDSLITGGTGSLSAETEQPDFLPDRFESGTMNVPGIIGISQGIDFVKKLGVDAISGHEYMLMRHFYQKAEEIENVKLLTQLPEQGRNAPIIGLNIDGLSSEETAAQLGEEGICVRAGLHCAPSAHRKLGTLKSGLVRFAPSVFTSKEDVERCICVLRTISENNYSQSV